MTVDEYLKNITPTQKAYFEKLRKIVGEVAPEAEEGMSYGIIGYKYRGKPLVYFGGFKDHMSIFPTSDQLEAVAKETAKFRTAKGTLQFTEENPIPDDLLRKIVETRLKNILG